MVKRILTAAVALLVFIGVLLAPPVVFTIALAAVIAMMLYECYKATGADAATKVVGFVSAAVLAASMYGITGLKSGDTLFILVFIAATIIILAHMALVVFKHRKRNYKDILSNGFLTFYIVVSMWCIQYARTFFDTAVMVLIFVAAWSCDTFAYFSGRFFGKRKLIPHVSPNKTVAGAVGGVAGSVVCCALYLWIAEKTSFTDFSFSVTELVILGGVIGLFGGAFSQLGDLAASAIKRDTEIKDFGWIFPGHGGFMDRFDSVMYIAPIVLMILIGFVFFGFDAVMRFF